jgi:hypothetical protein
VEIREEKLKTLKRMFLWVLFQACRLRWKVVLWRERRRLRKEFEEFDDEE